MASQFISAFLDALNDRWYTKFSTSVALNHGTDAKNRADDGTVDWVGIYREVDAGHVKVVMEVGYYPNGYRKIRWSLGYRNGYENQDPYGWALMPGSVMLPTSVVAQAVFYYFNDKHIQFYSNLSGDMCGCLTLSKDNCHHGVTSFIGNDGHTYPFNIVSEEVESVYFPSQYLPTLMGMLYYALQAAYKAGIRTPYLIYRWGEWLYGFNVTTPLELADKPNDEGVWFNGRDLHDYDYGTIYQEGYYEVDDNNVLSFIIPDKDGNPVYTFTENSIIKLPRVYTPITITKEYGADGYDFLILSKVKENCYERYDSDGPVEVGDHNDPSKLNGVEELLFRRTKMDYLPLVPNVRYVVVNDIKKSNSGFGLDPFCVNQTIAEHPEKGYRRVSKTEAKEDSKNE